MADVIWADIHIQVGPLGRPGVCIEVPKRKLHKDGYSSIFCKEPVLAREREARLNVEHCPKVFRSSPSMIKTFAANPNTSCGLRPRLRRDLDHAERQEESAVFTLLLAFSMLQLAVCSLDGAVWSVHLAFWALELIIKTLQAAVRGSQEAAWTLQRLSGGDNWLP